MIYSLPETINANRPLAIRYSKNFDEAVRDTTESNIFLLRIAIFWPVRSNLWLVWVNDR